MNILVLNAAGKCLMRPDTSINKENVDFYVPDDVDAVGWSPAVFARISKAGKAVQPDFAGRYFDSLSFGLMLHPSCEIRDGHAHYCKACAAVFDHSTIIPYPLSGADVLDNAENSFVLSKDGKEFFRCDTQGTRARIEEAIVKCSSHTSIRIGDFVAVELAAVADLVFRKEQECLIEGKFCENKTMEFKVIY